MGTALPEMKSKMWKRYIDDSFEIIKQDTDKKQEESPIMVTLPYVKGVSEALT